MPQCTACNHKEKSALNVELINGTPLREIQKSFGVSKSALSRHKTTCLPLAIAAALQTNTNEDGEDGPEPETVKDRAAEMCGKGRLAILHALKRKDFKTAFAGMREHRGYMETIGKITGELSSLSIPRDHYPMFQLAPGMSVNVTVNQQNIQMGRPAGDVVTVADAIEGERQEKREGQERQFLTEQPGVDSRLPGEAE